MTTNEDSSDTSKDPAKARLEARIALVAVAVFMIFALFMIFEPQALAQLLISD